MSDSNKLFLNPFYEGLSKKFILLIILLLIVECRGGSGWNLGKSLRKISKETARVL